MFISIFIILIVAFFAKRAVDIFINKAIRRSVRPSKHSSRTEERQREDTLINITSSISTLFYWPIIGLIIISQLGVNIAPLIAGAGVIGLAIGFGAQSLVKDIIAGLFIIAENQYRVGDVVELDQKIMGSVDRITLRETILRDLDGIEHHVPNGAISIVSNYSKEYSGINLNIGIAYESDLEKVIEVVNKVGDDLAKDKEFKDKILEKPQFLRVDNLGESAMDIKITGTVKPLTQWDVTGELRKRIKVAFDKNKIEIPYPQRVIHGVDE